MKILIHGPSTFDDYEFVVNRLHEFFSSFHDYSDVEIVAANTSGFCRMIKRYALDKGIKFTDYHVDFTNFGRQANYICNQLMTDYCKGAVNHCLVFWGNRSLILRNLIKEAIKTRMSVLKIPINDKK